MDNFYETVIKLVTEASKTNKEMHHMWIFHGIMHQDSVKSNSFF